MVGFLFSGKKRVAQLGQSLGLSWCFAQVALRRNNTIGENLNVVDALELSPIAASRVGGWICLMRRVMTGI